MTLELLIPTPRSTDIAILDHGLQPFLPELALFASTKRLHASPLYQQLQTRIEEVLGGVIEEGFSDEAAGARLAAKPFVRATAWNIERGLRLDGIIRALGEHPVMSASDVLMLTELDCGMARTDNRFIAREIATSLNYNYVFAPCYIALSKGNRWEMRTGGENTAALHGNALLSPFPLQRAHSLALPNGKDKMRGTEKRLGCQRAVVADVEHPAGMFRAVSLHLDAHSSQRHRWRQMRMVLDHLERLRPTLPTLIGGDWNTSGYNSKRALYSILGYWRRVLMGVPHVIKNHYPYPERWFERKLFRGLERRGYSYQDLNAPGQCTLHYHVGDRGSNENMADWIPNWCFPFINWALSKQQGRCSLKLDWFAGRNITVASTPGTPGQPPQVIGDLRNQEEALSDHDPVVLDFLPRKIG